MMNESSKRHSKLLSLIFVLNIKNIYEKKVRHADYDKDANCLDMYQILLNSAQRIILKPIGRIVMLSPAKGASDDHPSVRKDYYFTTILCFKICQDGRTLPGSVL